MQVAAGMPVSYQLSLGDQRVDVNALLGRKLRLSYSGVIRCCHCARISKKSFNQGYCYPCFQKLAQCDRCIMSPELCHFHQGTCREPEWAQQHCMRPHVVYLANSSGLKVGITRATQVPTRWIDQGAVNAIPLIATSSRYMSGLIEDALRQWLGDRTNWRKMLKHDIEDLDLEQEARALKEKASDLIAQLLEAHPNESFEWLQEPSQSFEYPHLKWPEKIKTYNLDKTPEVCDTLMAIKGQYLIFENACLNIRKYTSYEVSLHLED
ncbi:MAG: DUF2797 domain-containing protein [Oleiphilus sp.]|nr:MAG: DUF2797 domain-containing protein [Oleiphilus sp.]